MLIQQGYKYRLEPTAEQAARLAVLCGHARFVWNQGLRHCLELREAGERIPSNYDLHKLITQWKKEECTSWLSEAYTDNLQQKLSDLRTAWDRCFDPKLEAKQPRFKKKSHGSDSIRFVQFEKYCQLEGRRVKLPAKLGWMKFRHSRNIEGKIKNCTISQKAGHWYISFLAERKIETPQHPSRSDIGIDMGVAKFVTLSNGEQKEPLNAYRKHQTKLAIEQRKLARKVRFSQNWIKQNRVIQRLHSRIANCRTDFLHKTSTTISKNHAMVVLEDLRVSNMSKSAKGTADEPGSNVKAKSGLNKSILDQGWYSFRTMLEYKQQWRGGIVVAVPAQYTSQTCPECGHVSKDNRRTQASFKCVSCSYTNNADVVGAINVLERGHRLLACGESAQAAQ